jgi:membrane fusion protein, multidrug efflux system
VILKKDLNQMAENESKTTRDVQPPERRSADSSGQQSAAQHPAARSPAAQSPEDGHPHSVKAQRDEEIAEMERRSRHQPPSIQKPPEMPPAPPRKALTIVAVALAILVIAGGITLLLRLSHDRALAKETERETVPTVAVVHPSAENPEEELVLPGSLLAYVESPIYARTNGYLIQWYRDIGSRVTKGELLAKIDTPEVDQELNQARATQQQTAAQLEIARITAQRWENLRKTDAVSAQEADQYTSAYQQAQANLAAAQANVRRLEQLEGFKDVYAPFTGVLTRRNVDPGALINAGAQGPGRELFDIARIDTLRVFTSVPQAYAPFIKVGGNTIITLQELPGQKFPAKIARTADAIDPASRTLLTEVDVPNSQGKLFPGSLGEVHFAVGSNVDRVTVPVNAMLFRAQGAQVAVVGPANKIELRHLSIGRDYGTTLEVLGGLSAQDQIVVNPPDSLEDGEQVNVAQAPAAPANPDHQPQSNQQKQNQPQSRQSGTS